MEQSFKQVENLKDWSKDDEDNDNLTAAINEAMKEDFEQDLLEDEEAQQTMENLQQDPLNSEIDDTNLDSEKVFIFAGVFCRKLYCSQLRPREFEKRNVSGNSVTEVLDSVWRAAKKQVHRAVIFENEVLRWADDDPKLDDIQQFVTLKDTQKKKLYYESSLTPRVLRKWRDKAIKICVYVYSSNVENNAQYQLFQKKLIVPQNPDRSGANSTLDESILANELRDNHHDIEWHHSSWLLWANFINSSPVHEQDKLKASKAPPLELSKYFRWTSVSEAARFQSLHRGMVVAQTVNEGWSKEIVDVKKDVDLALTVLQGVVNKLNAMESRANSDAQLFSVMSCATQPEETDISRKLSAKIVDCPDVDHQ